MDQLGDGLFRPRLSGIAGDASRSQEGSTKADEGHCDRVHLDLEREDEVCVRSDADHVRRTPRQATGRYLAFLHEPSSGKLRDERTDRGPVQASNEVSSTASADP